MAVAEKERRYPRIKAPKSALVAWQTASYREVSRVENLALGGVFIKTKNPAKTGTTIQMLIVTPRGDVRVRANVRNVLEGKGMGVAIMAMDPEARGKLDRWLRQLAEGEAV